MELIEKVLFEIVWTQKHWLRRPVRWVSAAGRLPAWIFSQSAL